MATMPRMFERAALWAAEQYHQMPDGVKVQPAQVEAHIRQLWPFDPDDLALTVAVGQATYLARLNRTGVVA